MSMDLVGKSFQPPKWCCTPRSPRRSAQELRFVRSDGSGSASQRPAVEICDKAVYTIGRSDGADLQLKGDLASRLHAAVLQDADGRKFLVDLKSTHGTFMGSKRLTPHLPVEWLAGVTASFGSGPNADLLALSTQTGAGGSTASSSPPVKRRRGEGNRLSEDSGSVEAEPPLIPKPRGSSDALASLYEGLPEAKTVEYVPKVEVVRFEPLPPVEENPTKILFLDIDGVLRPVHGRQDAFQHARTMDIGGVKVPLLGSGEAKAGIDFWPSAMRALRHVVQKTGARLVLSSDWRKEAVLKAGIGSALEEYRMPPLYGETPDLDQVAPGVIKALHTSFREKRCKEIRKWLSRHPKALRWVAIDDVDLSQPDKEAKREMEEAVRNGTAPAEASVFLDPSFEFIRTNPTTGLTMELARLAVCYLNGLEVTGELLEAAYGASSS